MSLSGGGIHHDPGVALSVAPARRDALRPPGPQAPISLGGVAALLRGLNREQRRAVTHGDGPLLVVAGPGTGKTEVITRRVAWLIATKRASPSEILALTFTDKAAREMQARVDVLVPYGRADAAIATFHAFGDSLVREFAFELGLPGDVRVIDRAAAVLHVRERLFEMELARYRPLGDPTRFLGALVDLFQRAKDEDVSADAYRAWAAELVAEAERTDPSSPAGAAARERATTQRELAGAYAAYVSSLAANGLMDFGDQVALAVRLLREHASVRAAVSSRFRYILVDEFQDTNSSQLELLRLVAGDRTNVTVVGDDDQAIYTFRGAALSNMLGFAATYPAARRVVLRRNYRSVSRVLTPSRRLIRHNNPQRLEALDGVDKTLRAHRRGAGAAVRVETYETPDAEADGVSAEIEHRIAQGAPPGDIAILVRTNGDADRFLRSLNLRGIPWQFSGASGLYARPEVRQLVAFLRAASDPDSTVDVYALATGEPYRLGGADLTSILQLARRRHRSLWEVVRELTEQPLLLRLSDSTRERLRRLVGDLEHAMELAHERSAGEVLYAFLKRSGILARLAQARTHEDEAAVRNVARFFEIVRRQSRLLSDDRLAFLVPYLGMLMEAGDDPAADDVACGDAVSVLTVHKAKGLEFRVVYLVGLADGTFPARRRRAVLELPEELRNPSAEAGAESPLAEERRLCYVAMTRARDELVLGHARRSRDGRLLRPSPFLAEAVDAPAAVRPATQGAPADHGVRALLSFGDAPATERTPVPGRTAAKTPTREPLSLSFSQVDDYLTCPEKFRLRHVVRVPTPPHHALVYGNALHQAAAAFNASQAKGTALSEDELLEVFALHWTSEGFLSRAHEEARYAAGQAALRAFRERQLAAERVPVRLTAERPFEFALGRDRVRGRFDRVDETPDGVVITDYKSSDVRDKARADEKARESLQLQIYALAHQSATGELPAAVQLHFLESGVTGTAVPDERRLDRARHTLERAADGIRAGVFTPKPQYLACSYCPFRDVCSASAA